LVGRVAAGHTIAAAAIVADARAEAYSRLAAEGGSGVILITSATQAYIVL